VIDFRCEPGQELFSDAGECGCGCIDPEDLLICEGSGGEWDPYGCGHVWCGMELVCDAIVPGCNCGPGRIFEEGVGCVHSEECPTEERWLCEASGGYWDEYSCGHYWCGMAPQCEALIPGCNCGYEMIFEPGQGCVVSEECYEGDGVDLCRETGGETTLGCTHYICGAPDPDIVCGLAVEVCDCGPERVFDEQYGCVYSLQCPNATSRLCEATGGYWDNSSCTSCCDPPACGEPLHQPCIAACCYNHQCLCPEDRPYWESPYGCISSAECRRHGLP
jgi:hypothetical protein